MSEERSYGASVKDISELRHEEHRQLYRHWLDNRQDAAVPLRKTFEPLTFPQMLPRLAVIEKSGDTFRYRLAGTEIGARAGRDPTGKSFDDLYEGDYLESAKQTYRDIIEAGAPHFSQRVFPIGDGESSLRYDRLILPYSSDGSEIDQFILLIVVVEQNTPKRQVGSFSSFGRE